MFCNLTIPYNSPSLSELKILFLREVTNTFTSHNTCHLANWMFLSAVVGEQTAGRMRCPFRPSLARYECPNLGRVRKWPPYCNRWNAVQLHMHLLWLQFFDIAVNALFLHMVCTRRVLSSLVAAKLTSTPGLFLLLLIGFHRSVINFVINSYDVFTFTY
jgi:hypothetical protein